MITVLLADDHAVLRAGLRSLLEAEPDLQVVGEAATGEEAITQVERVRPDVVVMDLSMPGRGGLDAVRRIVAMDDSSKILVLTMHAEEEFLVHALDAGARGYVRKTGADEELIGAIRTVHRGEIYLAPHAARELLSEVRARGAKESREAVEILSARERQVLTLTAEGYSSTEIGDQLRISPKTVDTYRSRIMRKLHLGHRSELVRFALGSGLLRAG